MEKVILKEALNAKNYLMVAIITFAFWPINFFGWNPFVDKISWLKLGLIFPMSLLAILIPFWYIIILNHIDSFLFKSVQNETLFFSGFLGWGLLSIAFLLSIRLIGHGSLSTSILLDQKLYQILTLYYAAVIAITLKKEVE